MTSQQNYFFGLRNNLLPYFLFLASCNVCLACRAGVILASECSAIPLRKIMAAIFDFNGSGRLGREINLYQGGGRRSKIRRWVGVGVRSEDSSFRPFLAP